MGFLPIRFTKMSGAGNTFTLASGLENSPWADFEKQIKLSRTDLAKMICGKVLGINTDGFLLLEQGTGEVDYVWSFYNSDGSTAEMCGNAARCAARYCYEVFGNKKKSQFKFMTGAGIIETIILGNGLIRVQMPEVKWLQKEIDIETKSNLEKFALVSTGVPHLVQRLSNIQDAIQMKEMAQECRHHKDLQPHGANVTFYAVTSGEAKDKINAVTYERGVEDFTLACGTGAVAAAFVHFERERVHNIKVSMPGGNMSVYFMERESRPFLEGEAVFIGDFQYSLEVFL